MSLVADFRIEGDDFLLGEILARDPVAHIEMERVVPAARRIMPYVWVHGKGLEPLEASLRASEHVETLTRLDRTNGSALYRIDWADEAETLIDGIAEAEATVLEARGNEEWFFRIRFDSRAGLHEFGSFCRRRGISTRLNRLITMRERGGAPEFELTDSQRESLFRAVRDGYFEVPRRTTLGDIGDKLGITEQTVSENLRRGADKVLKRVLLDSSGSTRP